MYELTGLSSRDVQKIDRCMFRYDSFMQRAAEFYSRRCTKFAK